MDDLFYAYIAGMDTFARGLIIADRIVADGVLDNFIKERYSSYDTGIGEKIVKGEVGFEDLEVYAMTLTEITNTSGRQEMLEGLLNQYIYQS